LRHAVTMATIDAAHIVGLPWVNIGPMRQAALIDMSYNLGATRFAEFDTFLGYVRNLDWINAASDLTNNTAWAKQLPNRCRDDCTILTTGEPLNVNS
jgi:GH24 family phage-related lysozyme (muramidase)